MCLIISPYGSWRFGHNEMSKTEIRCKFILWHVRLCVALKIESDISSDTDARVWIRLEWYKMINSITATTSLRPDKSFEPFKCHECHSFIWHFLYFVISSWHKHSYCFSLSSSLLIPFKSEHSSFRLKHALKWVICR